MRILYKLIPMNASSAKYGPCEICGKPTSDVYHLSVSYQMSDHTAHHKNIFGCRECLEARVSRAKKESEAPQSPEIGEGGES